MRRRPRGRTWRWCPAPWATRISLSSTRHAHIDLLLNPSRQALLLELRPGDRQLMPVPVESVIRIGAPLWIHAQSPQKRRARRIRSEAAGPTQIETESSPQEPCLVEQPSAVLMATLLGPGASVGDCNAVDQHVLARSSNSMSPRLHGMAICSPKAAFMPGRRSEVRRSKSGGTGRFRSFEAYSAALMLR